MSTSNFTDTAPSSVDVAASPTLGFKLVERATPTSTKPSRKDVPLCTGVLDYFPLALAAVARLSKAGNDKHNPGQPLHWSRDKSTDHADCLLRHQTTRNEVDPETGELHATSVAWRALAQLQVMLEAQRDAP